MDRLTKRTTDGLAYLAKVRSNEQEIERFRNTLECLFEAWQHLAAYEDTGLTPERVAELAEAERESCDTCRQKQDGGSWLFNVYPCRECRHRTKSHYEAVLDGGNNDV